MFEMLRSNKCVFWKELIVCFPLLFTGLCSDLLKEKDQCQVEKLTLTSTEENLQEKPLNRGKTIGGLMQFGTLESCYHGLMEIYVYCNSRGFTSST